MGALKSDKCSRNHPMVPANLYIRGDGQRECLTCKQERNRGRKPGDASTGAGEEPKAHKTHKGESGPRIPQVPSRADGSQGVEVGDGKNTGHVAQQSEHPALNRTVVGSIPTVPTKNCPSCGAMNGMHQRGCKNGD